MQNQTTKEVPQQTRKCLRCGQDFPVQPWDTRNHGTGRCRNSKSVSIPDDEN